jgi:hypothetical protein
VVPVHRRKCGWEELYFQVKWFRFTVENAAQGRIELIPCKRKRLKGIVEQCSIHRIGIGACAPVKPSSGHVGFRCITRDGIDHAK